MYLSNIKVHNAYAFQSIEYSFVMKLNKLKNESLKGYFRFEFTLNRKLISFYCRYLIQQ